MEGTGKFTRVHARRLLNVARALVEAPDPKQFTMETFAREDHENLCATPACALGHYAARGDLQREFKLGAWVAQEEGLVLAAWVLPRGHVSKTYDDFCNARVWYDDGLVREHFNIDFDEAELLFGGYGCGGRAGEWSVEADDYVGARNCRSPRAAAKYIERFVRRRCKEAGIEVPAVKGVTGQG